MYNNIDKLYSLLYTCTILYTCVYMRAHVRVYAYVCAHARGESERQTSHQ